MSQTAPSQATNINKLIVVGGGTAGWMTAAALAKALKGTGCSIELIESDKIGTVGVGEATIPDIVRFNELLEIDEDAFIRATQATFKLGIEFINWGKIGDRYIHPFSGYCHDLKNTAFHHYWLKLYNQGKVPDIEEFSLSAQAARAGKFARMQALPSAPFLPLLYAFQFDAGLYANFLRSYAENLGVSRIEGIVDTVDINPLNGDIAALTLATGRKYSADFFIDCSGFKALLIHGALNVGYENWQHWLPCDKAWALACTGATAPKPYTKAIAHSAGWQWQIPLQHRTGNGHVFASQFMNPDQAHDILLANLPGEAQADAKLLSFETGRRTTFWQNNCVAIGLSSGFMEPLESTSIHLIQAGIIKLLALFPNGVDDSQNRRVYNQRTSHEYERIRDFLILHYKATQRSDSEFWRYCAAMDIPDTLANKIALYQETGHIFRDDNELFSLPSWLAVMQGQGIRAKRYLATADALPELEAHAMLAQAHAGIRAMVKSLPEHFRYIEKFCAAD
ncbi:tryptophan 7-halogenase [Simiduia curdlanivorans]|uniref:Tryptophan halogenase family protein n=1 Tax=Simiduia curdlanivorans TaxID=1492769 RepID=A0ABV8V158_9GAMM|nr:tryptophan halogenase family protein [Simiduia curdlanivorans]MDN3637877.1 tryptophan 7-halogenase [Simiduia curdlanivorans]